MAKAASQAKMNKLHDMVATVFIAVVERYLQRLTVQDKITSGEIELQDVTDEVLETLFSEDAMPSASMLAAITKFLKDNEVLFEKDKIEELSEVKKQLEERRKNRPNLANLSLVPNIA